MSLFFLGGPRLAVFVLFSKTLAMLALITFIIRYYIIWSSKVLIMRLNSVLESKLGKELSDIDLPITLCFGNESGFSVSDTVWILIPITFIVRYFKLVV